MRKSSRKRQPGNTTRYDKHLAWKSLDLHDLRSTDVVSTPLSFVVSACISLGMLGKPLVTHGREHYPASLASYLRI